MCLMAMGGFGFKNILQILSSMICLYTFCLFLRNITYLYFELVVKNLVCICAGDKHINILCGTHGPHKKC